MTKMTKLVVTLAATAAIAAPAAALASTSPDDRAYSRATSPALHQGSLGPDDRAYDRATVDIQPSAPKPVQVVVHDDGGFDWGDASTGGGAAFAVALILAGLGLLIARSRRPAIRAA